MWGNLITPFSLEEVKVAVWDCDSFKIPGSVGINFSFIKDFWPKIKDELCVLHMSFIVMEN